MAQFGAIYLSFEEGTQEKVQEIAEILKQQGYRFTIRYHQQAPWLQLYVGSPENASDYAEDLSNIFPNRHLIGLGAYTVSDSVIYCAWKNKRQLRLLQSGFQEERLWEKIEGEPQEWEKSIFGESTPEIGQDGMVSYHIQQIGVYFQLPGFGIPRSGESWTVEIIA